MRISHIALYVKDIEKVKEFYKKYFCAIENGKYHNSKTGLETYFLSFEGSDTRLEIMTRPEMQVGNSVDVRLGYIHLAISLGTKAKVDKLTNKLKNDGYTILSGPRITGDGYYESCVLDCENNQIEITE
ncbi:VOC family protein [[Clostridium] fimetarium]|uniref:Lactoylglutathione lyase n=1 Tax=[Clostridium] fimetarium TaxID=99656 RepID=A0A1I0R530_9FIRM|nr:VOC family protein [[Clostridium] fimetarium]SEW35669.1 lactoylglutathione lyase [[Clostridium] fimetarium]